MAQFLFALPSQFPLLPLLFLITSLCTPFSTFLAPSSCDRNCPLPSQVACKLTLFAPPFAQSSRPFQLTRTPTAQRLITTTLGLIHSCYAEHKRDLCVHVKNKPCVEYTVIMPLISWIHSRGSETVYF